MNSKDSIMLDAAIAKLQNDKAIFEEIVIKYETKIKQSDQQLKELKSIHAEYKKIINSTSWKITKPLRTTRQWLRKIHKNK